MSGVNNVVHARAPYTPVRPPTPLEKVVEKTRRRPDDNKVSHSINRPKSKLRTYFQPSREINLGLEKTKLFFGSRFSSDYYMVRNSYTLTSDPEDEVDQFRQRTDVSLLFRHDVNRYDNKSVVDGKFTLGNVFLWRTPFTNATYDATAWAAQDRLHWPASIKFKEAWINLNFDQLWDKLENRPHALKVGIFPFFVGRGISLGDWMHGGNSLLGFEKTGTQAYTPEYAPGILWTGMMLPKLEYDLYFSPAVIEDVDSTEIAAGASIVSRQQNSSNARHIFAMRLRTTTEMGEHSKIYAEPYFVYYNSPRQTTDRPADAPLRVGTFGLMWDHELGNFDINIEGATQFGKQEVTPWAYLNSPFVNISDGTAVTTKTNNQYDFVEVHDAYALKFTGKMAVVDMKYTVPHYPVELMGAVGYFSGGNYPYNDKVDRGLAGDIAWTDSIPATRDYKGFLPLRDYHYTGLWATPLVMFSAGTVPRPVDFDFFNITAYNDEDSATNLKYIGGGIKWYPLKEKDRFSVKTNLFWYWEDIQLQKWDKTRKLTDLNPGGIASGAMTLYSDEVKKYLPNDGWLSDDIASKFIGWEFNVVTSYKITENCDLAVRGGIFFPGQIYHDLAGQPNVNTDTSKQVFDAAGKVTDEIASPGLGTSKAYGLYVRMRYVF